MNLERWGETLLGAAVALVAAGFFAFAAAQGGKGDVNGRGYALVARFQRVDGISPGADVRMFGVKVGVVRSVAIDPESNLARLELWIDRGARTCADKTAASAQGAPAECKSWRAAPVEVLNDSTAKIQSDGLLGGAHVALEQAGLTALKPGEEILNTQPSVDLLTLLAGFARGGAGQDANSSSGASE
jgi:phospholipid/cholesterol/gamma-HCH transport system substrate-binding protein